MTIYQALRETARSLGLVALTNNEDWRVSAQLERLYHLINKAEEGYEEWRSEDEAKTAFPFEEITPGTEGVVGPTKWYGGKTPATTE